MYVLLFAFVHNATINILGLVALVWSLVYIPATLIFSRIGDEGGVNILSITSMLASLLAVYLLINYYSLFHILLLSYILHSIALSAGRISHSVSLNESYYFEEWSRYSMASLSTQRFMYAGLLIILYLSGLTSSLIYLVLLGSVLSIIYPFLITYRGFERRYSIVISRLNTFSAVSRYVTAYLDSSYLGSIDLSEWYSSRGSLLIIVLSAFLTSIAIEIVMTPIPAVLRASLGFQNLLIVYVIVNILIGLSLILFSGSNPDPRLTGSLRIIPLLGILFTTSVLSSSIAYVYILGVFYALLNISNNLFSATLYNMYNNRAYGFGLGIFSSIIEAGSLIGDTLLWLLLGGLGYNVIIYLSIALLLFSVIILKS